MSRKNFLHWATKSVFGLEPNKKEFKNIQPDHVYVKPEDIVPDDVEDLTKPEKVTSEAKPVFKPPPPPPPVPEIKKLPPIKRTQSKKELEQAASERNKLAAYPNTDETVNQHEWNSYGTSKNPALPHVTYVYCKQRKHGCLAKARKYENGVYKAAEGTEPHTHAPPVHSDSLATSFANVVRNTQVATAVRRNQVDASETDVESLKQINNRNYYEKNKLLAKDPFQTIVKEDAAKLVALKPFRVIVVNTNYDVSKVEKLHVDTTFKVLEDNLLLSTVIAEVDNMALPLSHMISRQVEESDYIDLLEKTKKHTKGHLNPFECVSDFDFAIYNAFNFSFPDAVILGDKWHFYHACTSWVTRHHPLIDKNELNLYLSAMVDAKNEQSFNVALNYMKESMKEFPEFIAYFEEQWIKKVPPKRWSLCGGFDPSDSLIENWHRKIKKAVFKNKLGWCIDEATLLLIDNINYQSTVLINPALLVQEIDNSKSKKKGLANFGVEKPKAEKKEIKTLNLDGRIRKAPRFYSQIQESISSSIRIRIVYPFTESRNYCYRILTNLAWVPSHFPYLITALDNTGSEKTYKLNSISDFDFDFYEIEKNNKNIAMNNNNDDKQDDGEDDVQGSLLSSNDATFDPILDEAMSVKGFNENNSTFVEDEIAKLLDSNFEPIEPKRKLEEFETSSKSTCFEQPTKRRKIQNSRMWDYKVEA